jgi:hypothetical protein
VVFLHGKCGQFVVISMAESADFSATKNTPTFSTLFFEAVSLLVVLIETHV